MSYKVVRKPTYAIMFDMETGQELLTGINGHPDPFSLEFPSLMDIGIMGHCPNECVFCYQGDEQQPNMKIEDYKTIIDQAGSETNQVALGGRGDPNKHEQFAEIIEYSVANNVIPNYTTSGVDLTDAEVEISKKCGAVAVSAYDKEFTYRALKMFMDAGIKTNIHFVFSKYSFSDAFNLLVGADIWQGKVDFERLNAVIFLLFKPQGRGAKLQDWCPTDFQVETFRKYMKNPKLPFKVGMDSCLVNRIKMIDTLTPEEELSLDTCEGARMSTYVSPDMRLMPCSFGQTTECGVDIKDTPIHDAWNNSQTFTNFRNRLKDNPCSCPYGL